MKCWRARDRRTNPELGWCPGVVELECPSVVCADPRRVYPEIVSECSVVWCPSVEVHGSSSAECVRVSRAGSLVIPGLDLEPGGACISLGPCIGKSEVGFLTICVVFNN